MTGIFAGPWSIRLTRLRPERLPQPAVPDRRASLDSVGVEAAVLNGVSSLRLVSRKQT